jgi:hypothetical protein
MGGRALVQQTRWWQAQGSRQEVALCHDDYGNDTALPLVPPQRWCSPMAGGGSSFSGKTFLLRNLSTLRRVAAEVRGDLLQGTRTRWAPPPLRARIHNGTTARDPGDQHADERSPGDSPGARAGRAPTADAPWSGWADNTTMSSMRFRTRCSSTWRAGRRPSNAGYAAAVRACCPAWGARSITSA